MSHGLTHGSSADMTVSYLIRLLTAGILGWVGLTLVSVDKTVAVNTTTLHAVHVDVETLQTDIKNLERRVTTMEAHHD